MNGDYTTPGMGNGQRKITAMGASEFTNQNPLPAVPLELQAIVKPTSSRSNQATNSNTSDYYLNQNFTLNNLKSILATDNPDIVHIATHAEFTGENPENSYIQLWDRRLTMAEIGQITWAKPYLDLLVLSACQTSLGNDQAELGFAGIALQSGVKTALASLWSVSDLGTLAIMADFYGQLDRGTTKAEALRQSQLNMLRGDISLKEDQLNFPDRDLDLTETVFANNQSQTEEAFRFTHPYYWSAFTIVGSPW
jgi:CHAT domain-containing protein